MNDRPEPRLVKWLSVFASTTAVFSAVVGLSGLAGWILHIPSLTTWGTAQVTMVANTAACFVLIGVSLWLLRKRDNQSFAWARKLAAKTAAAIVGMVGLLSLAEHLFRLALGIDQFLLVVPPMLQTGTVRPGLMSPITAGAFLLLGVALLGIDWRTRRGGWPAQFLSLAAGGLATFGVLSFAFDPHIYAAHLSLALPTAVTLAVFSLGLVCARTEWGLGALLCSQSLGGSLARRLLPAAFIPMLVGWIRWRITATGLYSEWSTVVLAALTTMFLLAGLIAWAAVAVYRNDVERRKVEEASHVSKEELDRLLNRIDEPPAEGRLRRQVAVGFVVAVLLTGLLGFFSWRNEQQAEQDADWVAHTHEALTMLETTVRHLVDVETGGRGFALTGNELFLEPYETGKYALSQDLRALHLLMKDNPEQERRLDVLGEQANAKIEASKALVAARQNSGRVPTVLDLEQEKKIMDAARITVEEMEAEEGRLLERRTRRSGAARHLTSFVMALGSVLGVVFLTIAGFSVSRQTSISARARAQVNALNADLELRVAQRTAALQSEIAERTRAEESLKESLATSETALKELADQKFALDQHALVAVTDVQGTITYVNDKFCAVSQYSEDELLGQNHRIVNSGHHPREFFQQMYHAIANGKVWHGEIKNRAKDGSIYWVDTTIVPFAGADGRPRQYLAIRADITERKRADEALHESQERFRLLLDGVKDYAIYMLDPEGHVVSWNTGAERIKGYRSEEILGKHFSCFYVAEEREAGRPARELQQSLAKGRFEAQAQRVRKDGSAFWANVVITPMYDDSGALRGFSKVARDITQQKADEREIRKLNDELEHRVVERTAQLEVANKELEAFSYSVSHDLRAPLRHISGFSQMLTEEFGSTLDPGAQHYLDRIQAGTQKMGLLVDELLNLARVGRHALNRQATKLNAMVAEVVAILQPDTAGRQVEWVIADLPAVECDPVLVKQVFQNLLANALKFTRPRGDGNAQAGASAPRSHAIIEISHQEEDGQPVFMVRDNGVGFSMKYVDKLFGVFQRLHSAEEFEGTGIGLVTVQRIVHKHGGRVWAEGELDKGAAFYFTLGVGKQVESKNNAATAGGQS
jgi:PAS domain S-box-containing protein